MSQQSVTPRTAPFPTLRQSQPVPRREQMAAQRDERDVVKVLQMEELFLRVGGYDRPPASRPGGPSLIFQDSPACPNVGSDVKNVQCAECALIHFVPTGKKNEAVPCRHIPLNDIGETVD